MGRKSLLGRMLVFSLRLSPDTVSGLSEIPFARQKIKLFCEGLVELNRSQQIESRKVLDERIDCSEKVFSKNSVKTFDVLHSDKDSLEKVGEVNG